ncbi:hypothetical protein EGW08_022270, partial [Elysia chlorotica]
DQIKTDQPENEETTKDVKSQSPDQIKSDQPENEETTKDVKSKSPEQIQSDEIDPQKMVKDSTSRSEEKDSKSKSQEKITTEENKYQEEAKDSKSKSQEQIINDGIDLQQNIKGSTSKSQEQIKTDQIAHEEMAKDGTSVSQDQIKDDEVISQSVPTDTEEKYTVFEFLASEMSADDKISQRLISLENKVEVEMEMITQGAVSQKKTAEDDESSQKQVSATKSTKSDEAVIDGTLTTKASSEDSKGAQNSDNLRRGRSQEQELSGDVVDDIAPTHESSSNVVFKYPSGLVSQTFSNIYEDNIKNYVSFIVDTASAISDAAESANLDELDIATNEGDLSVDTITEQPSTDSRGTSTKSKRKKKKEKMILPPLALYRPEKFEANASTQTYVSYPPVAQLPFYPKLAFPRKWGVPLLPAEPRTVLVGFTCPPAPRFRQDQLMTHSASTLRRYYSKPCIKTLEWIRISGKN